LYSESSCDKYEAPIDFESEEFIEMPNKKAVQSENDSYYEKYESYTTEHM
jgi:hypothetical protein